jgi:TolB-like protein/tetratricopeptide (TPR) repeat protein
MHSLLVDQLTAALGPGYVIERELDGGGMSRVFVAFEEALQRRVAVKVLPEHLAASVSVDRFKREILLSAGLQHPHIVGVLSAGEAAGLPYFVMPYVEGESLGTCIATKGALSVRETVSILKDVARALAYAHERGVVHRDIKPHNILLAAGAATVTDFGVAKAISSARRSGAQKQHGTLTGTGTSLGTPLYMAPEQAAADPDVDHRADIYAFGITAYEMLTGHPPFAGLAPRALLAARMTQDPPSVCSLRPDAPTALDALVMRCLKREPSDRPQSAAELLAALDDPSMMSGAHVAPGKPFSVWHSLRDWRVAAAAILVLGGVGTATAVSRRPTAVVAQGAAVLAAAVPAPSSIVVVPLVSIGADSGNAYLADGITNELAAALGRMSNVHVVSPSRAAAMLAAGHSPSDIGKALNVALQLEGTVQREGKRLRVTARLVNVSDGVMKWSDMYERDATDLLTVQEGLARAITDAVGSAVGGGATQLAFNDTTSVDNGANKTSGQAYDLYLRGRFQLNRRSAASLQQAITYFQQAISKDGSLAPAYSGLADAQGLLPLYTGAAAQPTLAAALKSADRAIALDTTLAEAWASRGVLQGRSWKWIDAERDFRRAIALNGRYAPAQQWLGEMLLVTGRVPESTRALERAAQLDPSSPVIAGALGLSLGMAGRSEGVSTAERAVSYDSTLVVTRVMLGMTQMYLHRPAAAIAPLEAAIRIDPTSRMALGLLGYAYGVSGDTTAARRMRARVESMPAGPGSDVAIARIAIGLRDTTEALNRLEKAARARDPFFATESATSPIFDSLRSSARYSALLRSVGVLPPRVVASRGSSTSG